MLIVERPGAGQSVALVAAALGITPRTARKWRDRSAAEGEAGLRDRPSRPRRSPRQLSAEATARIAALRRPRRTGPAIARELGLAGPTVGLALRRAGPRRLAALGPRPAIARYEREHPGELIHIDLKKLGRIDGVGHRIAGDRAGQSNKRGTGREHPHVAVDDAPRLARTALPPDERKESAAAFLDASPARFRGRGVVAGRVMTDNGSAYVSRAFARAVADHELRHKRTRPCTPRANGEAGRLIQSGLREWACATPFETSAQRAAAMRPWLHGHDTTRPHSALGGRPPISRLPKDNLPGSDS